MPFTRSRPIAVLVAALAVALAPGSAAATGAETTDSDIAQSYLRANAGSFGVTGADVAELGVTSNYRSAHNGITHVNLNQKYGGREVFGGHATVNIGANGEVVFAGGSLARLGTASGEAALGATDAVAAAADALGLDEPSDLYVIASGGGPARETLVSDGGIAAEAIPARLGWQPVAGGLRLAWQLTIDVASEDNLWNATVDAESGKLLKAVDWTIVDDHEDLAATVTGGKLPTPAAASAPARAFSLNPVDEGSSYLALDLALESPNDGAFRLVENPADETASPFGWHDTDGAAGAEFTITRGNNTHAYLDQDANNAADAGGDVNGGAGLDFVFAPDLNEHSQNYRNTVVTNLFFGCNTFHDVFYLYGFNEVSGNFQANNYGKGGGAGDYVRCEAADGGGTNNANFSTPAMDSGTPRMQMFLWPGNQFGAQNQVVVDAVGTFNGTWARFGAAPYAAGTSGAIVNAGNGCAAGDYSGAPGSGDWIAIVTGSNTGCQNVEKTRQAGSAGAKAIIVAHTTTAAAPVLTGSQTTAVPNIPVVSITLADGNSIRNAVAAGPTTGTVRKNPAHPGIRDGDLENGIIFHEYGHGLSNRLTGGPGINCLGGSEQAGEGWSDYVANTAMIDPALDDPEGPRGMGPYALFQPNRQGNGIRPRPYSRNMQIQPATYDSIKTNAWLTGSLAVPHGIGHAWAAMLWDMTWDLIDKHGFGPNVYTAWNTGGNNRSLQYVVDGLKLQGCNPTFVTARNAIIAAANTLGGGAAGDVAGDSCTLWAAFSRRGLGFSAVGGGTGRDDNSEAFDTNPPCRRGFQAPIHQEYGQLNTVGAGRSVPLRFTVSGATGLDILASNSPFSRKVDCTTLRVPSIGERITPREYPINTSPSGKSGLSRSSGGVYTYSWKTEEDWVGTCRELVLTRTDGVQHRAFFRFVAAE